MNTHVDLLEKQLKVKGLKAGMFVSRLDRPWTETDFPMQGLYIRGQADIDQLAKFCHAVFIDEARCRHCLDEPTLVKPSSSHPSDEQPADAKAPTHKPASKIKSVDPKKQPNYIDPASWKKRHCIERYNVSENIERELINVTPLVALMEHQIETLHDKLLARQNINVEPLAECTADLIESLIRNPDALAWVSQIMITRKPVMLHMIRLTVWAGIIGRQLGLNRFSMVHLSMALMMTGVGKSFLKDKVLRHHNVYEHSEAYQAHLEEALYHLKDAKFSCKDIITTIENYCERHNGTGYPNKKRGNQIPFLARVAGLIDTYEYLTHPFNNSAISPANAIVQLNKIEGKHFDAPLVDAFIHAMGIYPTGSLVEVNNGIVGIVVSNSYEKRIRAKVIPLVKPGGSFVTTFSIMDLDIKSTNATEQGDLIIHRGLPIHEAPQGLVHAAHQQLFEPKRGFFTKFFN